MPRTTVTSMFVDPNSSPSDEFITSEWEDFLARLRTDEEAMMTAAMAPEGESAPTTPAAITALVMPLNDDALAEPPSNNASAAKDIPHSKPTTTTATRTSSNTETETDGERPLWSSQSHPKAPPTVLWDAAPGTAPGSWYGLSGEMSLPLSVSQPQDMPTPLTHLYPLNNSNIAIQQQQQQQHVYTTAPIISLMPGTTGTPPQHGLSLDAQHQPPLPLPNMASRDSCENVFSNSQSDAPPTMCLHGLANGTTGRGPLPSSSVALATPKSTSILSAAGASLNNTSSAFMQSGHVPDAAAAAAAATATTPGIDDPALQSNLFVCGLASDMNDDSLERLFAPYGEIESAKVMLDIRTGRSRCIAFVKYTAVEAAHAAIEALNGVVVHGQCLKVRVANSKAAYLPGNPTNKTFLRNVPLSVTREELMTYFSKFGEVTDISIHADSAAVNRHGEAHSAGLSVTSQGGLLDAERSSTSAVSAGDEAAPRLNIVFVTFSTKEAAAAAAAETHTKTPFKDCKGVPLLAKVAEDSSRRVQRLARRTQGTSSGNNSHTSMSVLSASLSGVGGASGSAATAAATVVAPALMHTPTGIVVMNGDGQWSHGGASGTSAPPPYVTHLPQQQHQQPQQPTHVTSVPQSSNVYPPTYMTFQPQLYQQQQQQSQQPQQIITVLVSNGQNQTVPVQMLAPMSMQSHGSNNNTSNGAGLTQAYLNSMMTAYTTQGGQMTMQAVSPSPSALPQQQQMQQVQYCMLPPQNAQPQWM